VSSEVSAPVREVGGYRLLERIGAGGYGEVWKSEAPGGLSKAVKLVFGFHDEARASRELKALLRIKDLRHPFLLSLERIDVIDSQLVVVTELADCSLKDRFDVCRKEGQPGIARDELLRYLSDSAEALDHMTENYSLQHLDVKPENLLVVGLHAKVADFGLVKSIQDVTASMMAGLTPLYASPEVFNDQPSRQSDQYSLAIVFQEMLTGTLPFPGKNLAQLTAQHLNSPPRLNMLAPRDRDILSKALAKKPHERYRNCRELIDALSSADGIAHVPHMGSSSSEDSSKNDTKTINCSDTKSSEPQPLSDPSTIRMTDQSQQISRVWDTITPNPQQVVPPVTDDRTQRQLRPTVVIGLGGLGIRIVKNFIERRQDLVGLQQELHWCQALAVDTDTTDLLRNVTGNDASTLPAFSTVEMPLRRPQAYRGMSKQLTRSLSRRWLYNIPLSMKTEGMRPLGRLAFADHAQALRDQLREAVRASVEAVRSQFNTKSDSFQWDTRPRIVLAMSSSGGTGSGMAWDALAMAQEIIAESGGTTDDVSMWLLHASPKSVEQQDLARCNTFACLRELYHFLATGHYPGDEVTRIPSVTWGQNVSKQVSLFKVDDVDEEEIENTIDHLSDLLYVNVYEGRETAVRGGIGAESEVPSVSAWRFAGQSLCPNGQIDEASIRCSVELIRRWQGKGGDGQEHRRLAKLKEQAEGQTAREEQFNEILKFRADKVLQDSGFGLEQIVDLVKQMVHDEFEAKPEIYLTEAISRFSKEAVNGGMQLTAPETTARMLESIDQLIGKSNPDAEPGKLTAVTLYTELAPYIRQLAQHYQGKLLSKIHEVLNESSFRLRGVKQLAIQVDQHLMDLEQKARAMGIKTEQELEKIRAELFPVMQQPSHRNYRQCDSALSATEIRGLWLNYAMLRTHSTVVLATCQVFQHLRGAIMRDNMWIKNTSTSLEMAERKLSESLPSSSPSNATDTRFLEQVLLLERLVDQILVSDHGGLCHLLHKERHGIEKLNKLLIEASREIARHSAMGESTSASDCLSSLKGSDVWTEVSNDKKCSLTALGSSVKRITFMPESVSNVRSLEEISDIFQQSSLMGTKVPKVIWMESSAGVPLRDAARLLVDNRPDYVPVADRLLTRADIHWAEI